MKTEVEHFYWVPSAQDNPGTPAWHLAVNLIAETMEEVEKLGGTNRLTRTLNIAQAKEIGIDLEAIFPKINASSIAEAEKLRTALAAAAHEIEALQANIGVMQEEIEALQAKLAEAMKPQAEKDPAPVE